MQATLIGSEEREVELLIGRRVTYTALLPELAGGLGIPRVPRAPLSHTIRA